MKYPFYLFIFLTVISCKDNVEQYASVADKLDKRTVVEIVPVQQKTASVPVYAIGRLESDAQYKLSFKIGGVIAKINADEGQRVRKGQTLASLRSNEIDAQVLKAKQALAKAKRDLERINKMYAEEAATLENVQDLTTLVEVSEADLEIAEFNQKYAKITAPVSGRILRRLAEPNELVSPGQPLFILASDSGKAYVMKAALSDRDVARVNYGDPVKVEFDAFPGLEFQGKISLIAEAADPRTGTFMSEISLDAQGKRLRSGYIGRAVIEPAGTAPYLTIPTSALVEGNDKEITVFLPSKDKNTAQEIQLKPIHIASDYIAVQTPESGVFSDIITTGAPYLNDGDSIRVVGD